MRSTLGSLAVSALALGPALTPAAHASTRAQLDDVEVEFVVAQPSLGAVRADAVDEGIFVGQGRTDRILIDKRALSLFAYSLSAVRVAGTSRIRVTLAPASEGLEERLRAFYGPSPADAWQRLFPGCPDPALLARIAPAPSQFPPSQILNDGDTFLFEALVHPTTGQKLVDVIKVSLIKEPPMTEAVLRLKDSRLIVNGRALSTSTSFSCEGRVVYFFLKDRGRYLISAGAREGYELVAMLRTDRIELTLGGDRFEWISSEPIVRPPNAPATGKLSIVMMLWVRHEPDWKPPASVAPDSYGVGGVGD